MRKFFTRLEKGFAKTEPFFVRVLFKERGRAMPKEEGKMEEKKDESQENFVSKNKELVFDKIDDTKEGVLLYVNGVVYCISHGC